MSDGHEAIDWMREEFGGAVLTADSFNDQHWAEVSLDRLLDICTWLRDDPRTQYDYLVDVTAVHWPDQPQPMEMVYHLYSVERNDRLRLKARTGDTGPVPSVASVWLSADWNERETYDMFGIEFSGHPDPRRILMPDDYTDFPLRKEFPLYRG